MMGRNYDKVKFETQFQRVNCHGTILMRIATECFWSPAIWKGNKRSRETFEYADFCALDFENPMVTIEEIENLFCDTWFLIGTTRNHRKQKGNIPPIDRFRLVLKWDHRITDANEYEYNVKKLADEYGADLSSCSAQHPFFPCQEIVCFNFDIDTFTQPVFAMKEEEITNREEWIEKQESRSKRGVLSSRTRMALSQEVPEGGRHKIFFMVACELARAGIAREEAEHSILSSPTFARKSMTKDLINITKDVRRAISDAYHIVSRERENKKGA